MFSRRILSLLLPPFLVLAGRPSQQALRAAEPSTARSNHTASPEKAAIPGNRSEPDPARVARETMQHLLSTDVKLFASAEDLHRRTDQRRMLPGGPAEKKSPALLREVEDLEKQNGKFADELGQMEEWKRRNPAIWTEDLENDLLQLKISEGAIAQNLAELRPRLVHKHRWWLPGS